MSTYEQRLHMRASGRSPGSRFASCAHDAAQAHEDALNALELLTSTELWKAKNPQETRNFSPPPLEGSWQQTHGDTVLGA